MTSLLQGRKFEVHILYRSKNFNGQKIWASDDTGTEATLRHRRDDVYVMEVSERGEAAKIVLEVDFRKIKSYTMRTRSWHEMKYEGKLVVLHFTETDGFDDFFAALERVLKIYRKYTKPKNDQSFLREVQMFQLKALKPVGNLRREGAVTSAVTDQESGRSSASLPASGGRKTPVTKPSKSLNIFERFNRSKQPDQVENTNQVKRNMNSPPQSDQRTRGTSETAEEAFPNRRSTPQSNPPRAPPPRRSGDDQTFQRHFESGSFPDRTSVSSDEDNYSVYTQGTTYGPMDDEAFERPPPLPPKRTLSSSTNSSSASDPTEPSRTVDNRPKTKQKPTKNPEVSAGGPPPVAQASKGETKNRSKLNDDPTTPERTKRPSDPKRPSASTHQPPPSSPLPPLPAAPQLSSTTIYGTAMEWRCSQCTLRNPFHRMDCSVCSWTREDAWSCTGCEIVYSNDVAHCFECPVWRCGLCTTINTTGGPGDTTLCPVCGQ